MSSQVPIPWQQSTGMVGAYASQALGTLAAVAAALLAFSSELPRWLVIVCAVIVAVVGGGGIAVGVSSARKRRAKGEDPRQPEAPIEPAVTGGTGAALVALLAAGGILALALGAQGCSSAPLSPEQGVATQRITHLSCEIARELVRPDVLPVPDEVAALADRVCSGLEIAVAFVVPMLSGPRSSGPALTSSVSRALTIPCVEMGARCSQPGMSRSAVAVCAEIVSGCQAGETVKLAAEP